MASYTLGLDLGSASIGWALVEDQKRLIDCGVRIFDPGVNLEEFTKGIEGSSNNTTRRMARLHRRQLRRRAGRQRDLFALLQRDGLLPRGSGGSGSLDRHSILQRLDADLRARWRTRLEQEGVPEQSLIYLLRKRALDERLECEELGRVLYHLSQRRGFKSNRRDKPQPAGINRSKKRGDKEADELGKVKTGINELSAAIAQSGARTLGEYFVSLTLDGQRIRARWTDRRMYMQEFEAIWNAQVRFHSQLTPALKGCVQELLFFQRPISQNEHLVGFCELELSERRAPMANLVAQHFRLLQRVNDLEYVGALDTKALNSEQRTLLLQKLESEGDLKFDSIRQLFGFSKSVRFNLERGGEKRLPGNRTNAEMLRVLPNLWREVPQQEKDSIISICLGADNDEQVIRRFVVEYGLAEDDAVALCNVHLEDGYHRLSVKAMARILPLMESGVRFKTAEEQIYGTSFSGGQVFDLLAPVEDVLPQVPNPAVTRALTELRKLVNALVRKYGKPTEIRVELARELKRSARQRESDWKQMRGRESEKEKARKRILEEAHRPQPSGLDIDKVRLFEECCGICAYCGNAINFQSLFDGDIEVEHILPRNRFPDSSFANKTLAHRSCNQRKLGRTPFEAFGTVEEEWPQILGRVEKWKNPEKLQRFKIADPTELDPDRPESFAARRLNDTRYTSKLAARYLASLYGGRDMRQSDGSIKRIIFASSGLLTATLRRQWKLESILREPDPAPTSRKQAKPRGDHRHHAVDAIVIALSSNSVIQGLGIASVAGDSAMTRFAATLQQPWGNFVDSVRPLIEKMIVSHRPSHRLQGPLHEETNYSAPRQISVSSNGKRKPQIKTVVHVRKPVHTLTEKQIQDIVDPAVRVAVISKLEEVGNDPKKLEVNYPMLRTRTGKHVPILRVRVRMSVPVTRIATGERERYVASAGNHHVAVFETIAKNGGKMWESPGVVSRLEATQRKRAGRPIIEKVLPGPEDARYLFNLMGGDVVEMDDLRLGRRNIFVVRTISDAEINFVRHSDARRKADLQPGSDTKADLVRTQGSGKFDKLRQWNCRKLFVDVLGKVRE